eukprot:m.220968 g.220968  ORF g.220968 m.220968 type:complete len:70 (+) comp17243_c0_seq76:1073-1282(+)
MILSCQSAQDEAQKVVQAIVTGVHACQPHLPLNEVAILLRTNQMTRPFEEVLACTSVNWLNCSNSASRL